MILVQNLIKPNPSWTW